MLAQSDGVGRRTHARDCSGEKSSAESTAARAYGTDGRRATWRPSPDASSTARILDGEGERDFDLRVFGKRLGARHVHGAARTVDAIRSRTQRVGCAVIVTKDEIGGVHQDFAVAFRGDCEAPQN